MKLALEEVERLEGVDEGRVDIAGNVETTYDLPVRYKGRRKGV